MSNEEFERYMLNHVKAAPIQPSRPPTVGPRAVPSEPPKPAPPAISAAPRKEEMVRCFKSIDSIRDRAHAERVPSEASRPPAVGLYYEPDPPPGPPAFMPVGLYYEPDPPPRPPAVKPSVTPEEPPKPPASASRKKKARPTIPQEEEMQRFFSVIDSARDRAIFRVMYHAGLRASEIGLLEMRDYAPRTDRLMVDRLKGSNSGEHHLNREELRALKAWLKIRGSAPGAIFPSKKRRPIGRKMLDVLVKDYGARAGWPLKLRHCHSFKHACCTHLLSKGFNVEQVQDWVGHANIANTMIYARVTNSRRDQMGKALADWK